MKAGRSDEFRRWWCREEFGGGEMIRELGAGASSLRWWWSLTQARLAAGLSVSVGLDYWKVKFWCLGRPLFSFA